MVTAVAKAVGAERVGLRISPEINIRDAFETDRDDVAATYATLLDQLRPLDLAYLSVLHSEPGGELVQALRRHFGGKLIVNSGFLGAQTTRDEAVQRIEADHADAVVVGRALIANPDLIERWQGGHPQNYLRQELFYAPGAEGYTDYPFLQARARVGACPRRSPPGTGRRNRRPTVRAHAHTVSQPDRSPDGDAAARNMITGFARVDGRSVGVVANQPLMASGFIDARCSDKAAHFIRLCDAFGLPLIFVVDTPGCPARRRRGKDRRHQTRRPVLLRRRRSHRPDRHRHRAQSLRRRLRRHGVQSNSAVTSTWPGPPHASP